jgi:hypothetical protein
MVDKELSGAPSVPHIGFLLSHWVTAFLCIYSIDEYAVIHPQRAKTTRMTCEFVSTSALAIFTKWRRLPRLKDGKVVGMADEDTPEEPQRQETIEGGCAGVLLGVCECGKGHLEEFE